MSDPATWRTESMVRMAQRPNSIAIEIGSKEEEMARCQPTEQDFARAWETVDACNRAIEEDPRNAAAYRDRALALALLGRERESRQNREQAARLGLDRDLLEQEASLIQQIAIGRPEEPAGPSSGSLEQRKSGWRSAVSGLFGR